MLSKKNIEVVRDNEAWVLFWIWKGSDVRSKHLSKEGEGEGERICVLRHGIAGLYFCKK